MSTKTGIFTKEEGNTHVNSEYIADVILYLFQGEEDKYIIDFGCGNGYYLNHLKNNGFSKLIGIDGVKLDDRLFEDIEEKDLTQPIFLEQKGHVICLEVGEHIPAEFQETLLDNITRHCNGVLILSWAIPGQPGIGHVNCRTNEEIIKELSDRNFMYMKSYSDDIRQGVKEYAKEAPWFANTFMVFLKTKD